MDAETLAAEVQALKVRLYAALRHSRGCSCGECSGGLNAVDSLVALAARVPQLEAERDEWERAARTETAVKEAAARLLEESEARVAQLETALADMHHHIQTRRTGLHMDGTEMFSQPILARLNSIARTALEQTP